jgi:hypothetical protein
MLLGSVVGSKNVNTNFEEHVMEVTGEDFFYLRRTRAYSRALRQFQLEVMPLFMGEKKEWIISFPMAGLADDEANGLRGDFLRLSW